MQAAGTAEQATKLAGEGRTGARLQETDAHLPPQRSTTPSAAVRDQPRGCKVLSIKPSLTGT